MAQTKEMNALRNDYIVHTKGVSGVNEIEYQVPELRWFEGLRVGLSGHSDGDTFDLQIHVPELVNKIPTGNFIHVPELSFGESINVNPDKWLQLDKQARYWSRLPAGVKIVLKYNRTLETDVKIYVDFFFHKER